MSNFTGQQINLTYKSLLHFSNDNGLTVNTRFRLYDGAGVATCLQLAASGETPIFDTDVRVNEVLYPGEMGNQFDIMYQTDSDGTLALGNIYDVLSFANNGQAVNGTISNVKSLTIQDGIIVGYTTAPTVHTFLLDLETFNPALLSAVNGSPIDSNVSLYPYNKYTDCNRSMYWNLDPELIKTNYLEKIWFNSSILTMNGVSMYGTPAANDYAIVVCHPSNVTRDDDYNPNIFSKLFGVHYKYDGTSWVWQRTILINGAYRVEAGDHRTTYEDYRDYYWSVANFGPVNYNTPALSASSPFIYSATSGANKNVTYRNLPANRIMNKTRVNANGSTTAPLLGRLFIDNSTPPTRH